MDVYRIQLELIDALDTLEREFRLLVGGEVRVGYRGRSLGYDVQLRHFEFLFCLTEVHIQALLHLQGLLL